jgi:hypothetical protein
MKASHYLFYFCNGNDVAGKKVFRHQTMKKPLPDEVTITNARPHRTVENRNSLIVCFMSFNREDWACVSCETYHPLLPLRAKREFWEAGRKLIFLTDQNMTVVIPSKDELCPIVVRIDGGLLCKLGTTFLELLCRYTVPEGSFLLIGSVSHHMEEG